RVKARHLRISAIYDAVVIVLLASQVFVGVIPGRVRSTQARNPHSPAVVMGSGLAALRRPGMTSRRSGGFARTTDAVVLAKRIPPPMPATPKMGPTRASTRAW